MIDLAKRRRQLEMFGRWQPSVATSFKGGTCVAATAFGKSFLPIHAIQTLNRIRPGATTIVVVPLADLKNDWLRTSKKLAPGEQPGHIELHGLQDVQVMTYNAAVNQQRQCHLLVLDEIHVAAAPRFRGVFTQIGYNAIMGLTAKLERLDGEEWVIRQYAPVVDTVTLQECVLRGWVSPHTTYNLAVPLDFNDQLRYQGLTTTIEKVTGKFAHDYEAIIRCGAGNAAGGKQAREQKALEMGWVRGTHPDDITHPWSPTSLAAAAMAWKRAVEQRKNILYNSPTKRLVALRLLRRFQVKSITFGESVEMANQLQKVQHLSSLAYHSKELTAKQRREILGRFRNPADPVRTLHTARALDVGFNAEDIELGIVLAGTSSGLQNLQRTGRVVRFLAHKYARIVQLYVPDTQDEVWLRKRQKTGGGIPPRWITSLEDVT